MTESRMTKEAELYAQKPKGWWERQKDKVKANPVLGGTIAGAATGAAAGSILGGVGAIPGAVFGAAGGAVAGYMNKKD